jgi:chaperone required for assembly of F1-ATPase
MKRFWKDVASVSDEDGWRIELDARPVRTPARALLRLPTEPLAAVVAAEWREAGETVDPRAMPLTGLANAAIDRIAPEQESFAAALARYAASDLLCYRADSPTLLIERQAAHWDPLLLWARRRYDVDVIVTTGVAPVEQSADMLAKLHQAVAVLGPFELAGLSPLVTVGGSLIAALALYEQAFDADTMWAAISLDETWQLDQWGHDAEAEQALAAREADFRAGVRLLKLLD